MKYNYSLQSTDFKISINRIWTALTISLTESERLTKIKS